MVVMPDNFSKREYTSYIYPPKHLISPNITFRIQLEFNDSSMVFERLGLGV
jgi:hypothetical protein